jgi:Tfp pilus assembly protein PilF
LPTLHGLSIEQLIDDLTSLERPEIEEEELRRLIREKLLQRVYERLRGHAPQLLCRLSIFRRPVPYSALSHILSLSDHATRAPRQQLLNHFLLESDSLVKPHYLHALVREFGLEQLEYDSEEWNAAHESAARWWEKQTLAASWEEMMLAEIEQYHHLMAAGDVQAAKSLTKRIVTALKHKAKEAFADRLYQESIEYGRVWIEIAPNDAQAHWNMALCLTRLDQKANSATEAEAHFQRALALGLKSVALRNEYGRFLAAQGRHDEAETQFKAGIEAAPKDVRIRHEYGRFLAAQERYGEAETQFKLGMTADPKHGPLHNDYGRFLAAQRRYDEAEAQFKAGIEADPKHGPLRNEYAGFLSKLKRYDEAETQFKAGIEADPNHGPLRANYAAFLNRRGRFKEAMEHYQISPTLRHRNSVELRKAVRVAKRERRENRRLASYERALQDNSDSFEANYGLGRMLMQQMRDPKAAVDYLQQAVKLEPGDAQARLLYGQCLAELERWEDALKEFDIIEDFNSPELPNARGNCLLRLERWNEAETAYRIAIESSTPPGQAKYLNNLARLFAVWPDNSRIAEGLELCSSAELANPDFPWTTNTREMLEQRSRQPTEENVKPEPSI